jgi:hypothetical protein
MDQPMSEEDEKDSVHTAHDRIALLFHRPPSPAFVGDPAFFFSGEDLKEGKCQRKFDNCAGGREESMDSHLAEIQTICLDGLPTLLLRAGCVGHLSIQRPQKLEDNLVERHES